MSKQQGFFVTGSDTGVGKTVVAAILLKQWQGVYWKPIQTGVIIERDADEIQRLTGVGRDKIYPSAYELQAPLSPHAAAKLEKVDLQCAKIKLPKKDCFWIVEGAGGVMVPIQGKWIMLDLMRQLGLPIIVVTRSQLGTINHTLLTLKAIRDYRLTIAGVIMNGPNNSSNKKAIEHYGQVKVIGEINPFPELNKDVIDSIKLSW